MVSNIIKESGMIHRMLLTDYPGLSSLEFVSVQVKELQYLIIESLIYKYKMLEGSQIMTKERVAQVLHNSISRYQYFNKALPSSFHVLVGEECLIITFTYGKF